MSDDDDDASSRPRTSGQSYQNGLGAVQALIARQERWRNSLRLLMEEQDEFLMDMRELAGAGSHALKTRASPDTLRREHCAVICGSRSGTWENSQKPNVTFDFGGTPEERSPATVPSELALQPMRGTESTAVPSHTPSQHMGTAPSTAGVSHRMDATESTAAGNYVAALMSEPDGEGHETMRVSHMFFNSQFANVLKTASSTIHFDIDGVSSIRRFVKHLLRRGFIESAMSLLIFINVVNVGWAIERELRGQETWEQTILELIIVAIFWGEQALLFFAHGLSCFRERWFIFDFVLNLVTSVVLILTLVTEAEGSTSIFAKTIKQLLIVRMVRLLRLFRAARIIKMSKSLWKLVSGMRHCIGTMVAALTLMFIGLYVFACFGAELITKSYANDNDPQVVAMITKRFSSIPKIMLTCFQFITMDGTADIYVTLVQREPLLFIFFILLIASVTIMLMNLITALIVEDAITTAATDTEIKRHLVREKLQKVKPSFVKLFRGFDTTGTGTVHVQDIVDCMNSGVTLPTAIEDLISPEHMIDFFDLLDQDHSGELNEIEFVDGMCSLALSEVPLETLQILHLLRSTHREVLNLRRFARKQARLGGRSQPESASAFNFTQSVALTKDASMMEFADDADAAREEGLNPVPTFPHMDI